jgi:hypothetical protein
MRNARPAVVGFLGLVIVPLALYGGGYFALGESSLRLVGCCTMVRVRVFPSRQIADAYWPAASIEEVVTSRKVILASPSDAWAK